MSAIHVFTEPTRLCWNQITTQSPVDERNDRTIYKIALKAMYLIGLIYSIPLYFFGKFFEAITYRSPIIQRSSSERDPQGILQLKRIPSTGGDRNLIGDNPEGNELILIGDNPEGNELILIGDNPEGNELMAFYKNPTWQGYSQLPQISRYLIASRKYYNIFWSFKSGYALLEEFEAEFRNGKSLVQAKPAIQDAIKIQYKIYVLNLFRKASPSIKKDMLKDTMEKALVNQLRLAIVEAAEDSAIELDHVVLEEYLDHSLMTEAIELFIERLEDGYPSDQILFEDNSN